VRSLRIENAELAQSVRDRTAELEVARAEAKFRLAMDAARMGEIAVDLRSEQVIHTPAFARLFGYPPDRRLSLPDIRACWHPDDRERIIQERDTAIVLSGRTARQNGSLDAVSSYATLRAPLSRRTSSI
jgi:PAS domain-containing protein